MATTSGVDRLRRLLLGAGRLLAELRTALEVEDLVLLDEGLTGSVTYRNHRAPGRRSSWRKEAVSGAIVVTARRLVVWAGRGKHIDVPLAGGFLAAIDVSVEPPDHVCFAYDPARFNPTRAGTVEVRLRTAQAARLVELLKPAS